MTINLYFVCRKLNNTVERILKCVQTKQDWRHALQKPKCLPLSTEYANVWNDRWRYIWRSCKL